jgi:hypothetical protein
MRKGTLIHHDLDVLRERLLQYCDSSLSLLDLRERHIGPVFDAARFNSEAAREQLIAAGGMAAGRFAPIALYPFDNRWCFHSNVRPLWNEPRPEVAAEQRKGNLFVVTRTQARKPDEGIPMIATRALPGYHLLDPNSHPFPAILHRDIDAETAALELHGGPVPNLSPAARRYCVQLGLKEWLRPDHPQGDAIWLHALAIGYSPQWLEENEDGIGQDWPRVPLPNSAERLVASAALGSRVADLLDQETQVEGVTVGHIEPSLRTIGVLTTRDGSPASGEDYAVTAPWGAMNRAGAVMPGTGRVDRREYSAAEHACAQEAGLLGPCTRDVWLNNRTYWRNVPDEVWELVIGGYQVLKKWLSYRHRTILGRALTVDETRRFQNSARRIAKLCLMGTELDENYRLCAEHPFGWQAALAGKPSGLGGD